MKKLQDHLVLNLRPNANKENIVFWKDYRVTVLSDRLFRIEKMKTKFLETKPLKLFGIEICQNKNLLQN